LKLLVVGGGLTGLAAAYEASRLGAAVTVVEASQRLGGKVWTEQTEGFVIEHGPDSVVSYRPEALTLARELGLGDAIEQVASARSVFLRVNGALRPLPASMGVVLPARLWPFVTTRILTWPNKLRAGLDLVLPRQLGPDDQSIGQFLGRRLGRAMVAKLADPLVGGIYGASVDQLSIDAVLPSLRQNEREHRSLLLAARAGRPRGAVKGVSPFRALKGGMETLISALEANLRQAGVEIVLGQAASAADLADREWDGVVLAGGVTASAKLLAEHARPAAAALEQIPLSSSTVVTLAYDQAQVGRRLESHGWLEAQAAPVSGVTVASAKWAARAPAGRVLLRCFVPARLGRIAEVDDAELLAAVKAHLGLVLGVNGEPSLVRVTRWRGVMPSYTVGHLGRVAAVEQALAGTRWRVAGSALHGVGLPDCVKSGWAAARELLGQADE
jgi:oxygen-dependent protoporphyrinogen oxidase